MVTLRELFIYPVKGLAGLRVDAADVDELGLAGDRRFMLVDETGRFMSQRGVPQLARMATTLSADTLTLRHPASGEASVPRAPDPAAPLRNVSVWKSEGLLAEDCGDGIATWLGDTLHLRCRLVRIGPRFRRPILKPDVAGPGDVVHFGDAFPCLVLSEASLADLNDRLSARGEDPVPLNRFRPNFVVAGCAAFAEDTWTRFRLGQVIFRTGGPCARCTVTTIDQETAERGVEPLRTLATYRRDPRNASDVIFAQNLIHETKTGRIQIGDTLELLG